MNDNPQNSSMDHRAGRYLPQPTGYRAFIPEPLAQISADILALEQETEGLLNEITKGASA